MIQEEKNPEGIMARKNTNGKDSKTVQSNLSKDEYKDFSQRLNQLSTELGIKLSESAYIRKLILDDVKKGDSS